MLLLKKVFLRALTLFLFISIIFLTIFGSSCVKQREPAATPQPRATKVPPSPKPEGWPQWDNPPEMSIDSSKIYIATIKTEIGDIKFQMFADKAPITVNNFIFLAGEKYFDSSTFHRVRPDFMAQAGKPKNEIVNDPGYNIPDEIVEDLKFDESGYVAMSNLGRPNSGGSQFFITLGKTPWLDGKHTIFGKVIEGMDVVSKLTLRDPNMDVDIKGTFIETVMIETIPESRLPERKPVEILKPVLKAGKPLAKLPILEREFIYNTKPDMVITPSKPLSAKIKTTKGTINVTLRPDIAPESVNNFYILAKLGYWDNFPITHTLRARYVASGSPKQTPYSDIGYFIPKEYNTSDSGLKVERGIIGYWAHARMDGSSSGSVFYFMLTNDPRGSYATPFGTLTEEGLALVETLTMEDKILSIEIIE